MTGRLIAIVGPSGVGKDSVIDALVDSCPRLGRARRVITRADLGGEDFTPVTPEVFDAQVHAGAFALHWGAHGLRYGVPAAGLAELRAGRDVVANLSRRVLPQAATVAPSLWVVALSASPDVLAARLARRGREGAVDIAARLERAVALPDLPGAVRILHACNDGPLADTVAALREALYPDSGTRAT